MRFTLAGARQSFRGTQRGSSLAAALQALGRGRRRRVLRGLVRQSGFDFLQNGRKILRLGAHVARVVPLEMRFGLAIDAPIGVAQMIVDDGICGLQLDRLFQLLRRLA